jgi:predicted transcriptional regulator
MDILELVRSDLKAASLARQNEVAKAAGVPWSTLRKIVDGDTRNPRYDTVERLRGYYGNYIGKREAA